MPTHILNAAQEIIAGAEVLETIEQYELTLDDEEILYAVLEAEGWVADAL